MLWVCSLRVCSDQADLRKFLHIWCTFTIKRVFTLQFPASLPSLYSANLLTWLWSLETGQPDTAARDLVVPCLRFDILFVILLLPPWRSIFMNWWYFRFVLWRECPLRTLRTWPASSSWTGWWCPSSFPLWTLLTQPGQVTIYSSWPSTWSNIRRLLMKLLASQTSRDMLLKTWRIPNSIATYMNLYLS